MNPGKRQARPVIHGYSLAEILRYVNTVPVEEIAFIGKAYTMNLELLKRRTGFGQGSVRKETLS